MSSCRNSVCMSLSSVELQKFCLQEFAQCRVVEIRSTRGYPMSSCINSVHRRLPSVELYKFCPPEVTQCQVVDTLSTGGYLALSCRISIYWRLSGVELQKFCLPQVTQRRVAKFCPLEATKCRDIEILSAEVYIVWSCSNYVHWTLPSFSS